MDPDTSDRRLRGSRNDEVSSFIIGGLQQLRLVAGQGVTCAPVVALQRAAGSRSGCRRECVPGRADSLMYPACSLRLPADLSSTKSSVNSGTSISLVQGHFRQGPNMRHEATHAGLRRRPRGRCRMVPICAQRRPKTVAHGGVDFVRRWRYLVVAPATATSRHIASCRRSDR